MTPDLRALLAAVRRRTRLAWAVATSGRVAVAAAGLALGVVALARLRHLPWADAAAAVVGLAAAAGLVAAAVLLRLTTPVVARVADRGLGTGDAFATSLEVTDGPFAERVRRRAGELAAGRTADEAVTVRPPWRWLGLAAVIGVAAVALAVLPNHQDDLARRRAAERANARAAAAQTREVAEKAAARGADQDVVRRLHELARELERSPGEQASLRAVQQAAADVASQIRPDALTEKQAALGLDRSLEANPLDAAGGSAAQQLQALAGRLDSVNQAATAARLDRLAAAQSLGNPDAARALSDAAAALRQGDVAAAAAALIQAADAQRGAAERALAQEAAASAIGDLNDVAITAAPQNQQRGQGQGERQGGPQGQGDGQNRDEGGGQGNSAGQGQGQDKGAGSPTGGAGGTNAETAGPGEAQGGADGGGGAGREQAPGADPNGTATVYNPPEAGGPDLEVGGPVGAGPQGADAGLGVGPNRTGPVNVPLRDVLPAYAAEATRALDQLDLPPSVRELVSAYFENLAGL